MANKAATEKRGGDPDPQVKDPQGKNPSKSKRLDEALDETFPGSDPVDLTPGRAPGKAHKHKE